MNALVELKSLALLQSRNKFPSLPEYARVTPKYSDKTANGLTKCIIDYIRFKGGQAERISVTGRLVDRRKEFTDVIGKKRLIGSVQWIKPSMQPGTADISAIIGGRSLKIEVKVGRDTQRAAQKVYQTQVEQAGGIYLLISSFNEFYEWYEGNLKNL